MLRIRLSVLGANAFWNDFRIVNHAITSAVPRLLLEVAKTQLADYHRVKIEEST